MRQKEKKRQQASQGQGHDAENGKGKERVGSETPSAEPLEAGSQDSLAEEEIPEEEESELYRILQHIVHVQFTTDCQV